MKIGFGRRKFLKGIGAAGALTTLGACAKPAKGRVVIVGGGFGGATCAKYINRIDPRIDVILVEKKQRYVTCPFSNNVLGGLRTMDSITHDYDRLAARDGISVIHAMVTAIDPETRDVTLADGTRLSCDRLVLSPGIDMRWDAIEGYDEAAAQVMPHAWEAGPQTVLLQNQLAAMDDGGLVVIVAPANPYRCPPAPYERAAMIAHYLKTSGKTRSKIVILDAKDKFAKQALFMQGWKRFYGDMIEWIQAKDGGTVTRVDPATLTVKAGAGTFRAGVANVVPPQSAGEIAIAAGLANSDGWCEVDSRTLESMVRSGIYVLGDSCFPGDMPKSGFAANSQAKACAATIVAAISGGEEPEPVFLNTCYSTIAPNYAISVNGAYLAGPGRITAVLGSGGLSPLDAPDSVRRAEARYAEGWYDSMTGEMFDHR